MRDNDKTKRQLMEELENLREKSAELERIEAEHQLIDNALKKSEARYRGLFDNVPVALYRTTSAGQFLDANPAMVRMTGYPGLATLLSINAAELYANAEDRSRWQILMEQNETVKDFEFLARRYDGSRIWLKNTSRAIKDDAGCLLWYEGSLEDITFRKKAQEELALANEGLKARLTEIGMLQEQLRERAIRDPLTDLFNRRYLEEMLDLELIKAGRKAYQISLIMMDIDRFKRINDTYGHKAGDKALQAMAACILSCIRSSDIACRFGGDEFVIVMPEAAIGLAYERAEELRRRVQSLRLTDTGMADFLTVSSGISVYPAHGATRERLLRSADQALYLAKAQGRNRVVILKE
jgi:diguanylate cyclase (GGDEF)-like protein/PAS domain S-box-containing protein